ncbi:MAG: ABC transporter permease [bacterium]
MLRHVIRRLVRAPAFTLAATLTLTLGIGGAVAVFTMVNGVLLRPLPYDRPERLVDLSHVITISGLTSIDQSDATYLLYRRDNHVFTDVGAYRSTAVNLGAGDGSRPTDGARAERVGATLASASVFGVLRARAIVGRVLSDEDDRPGSPPVALIGERLWQRDFAADPGIAGKRVMIDGVAHQIVGVMPARFQFPNAESDLWVPLQLDPAKTKSAAFDYRGVARLRDGVSLAAALGELRQLLPRVPVVFPGRLTVAGIEQVKMQPVVRPLRDVTIGDVGRVLWIVLGAVGLLLFIACANVANLFLARAEGRQRELAVRSALGAGRTALLMELSSEAAVLAAIGGALGLGGADVGVRILKSMEMGTAIPRLAEVTVDGLVVAVAVGIAAVAALVVSVLPLARLKTGSLSSMLIANGRSATSGRAGNRARRGLVVAQVALVLVLVSGAGLFARSFSRLRSVDPGFATDHALTFRIAMPDVEYPTTREAARTVVRVLDAIGKLPGVQSAGVITKLPLTTESRQDSAVYLADQPLGMGAMPNLHQINFVTPSYFQAMRIPLVAGRLFDAPDVNGEPSRGPPEAIVSAAFAARYWGGAKAIGKLVRMNAAGPWQTIVGIVGDVHGVGLAQPPADEVYSPLVTMNAAGAPWIPRNLAFVVRGSGDPARLVAPVRRAVAALDQTLPLYRVMPMTEVLAISTARTTFTLLLLSIAAAVATTIGALGIYGVISYLVSLRTREIGVRLALGADARDVRLLVARQAMIDALIGVGVGLAGAVTLTRVLGTVLFDVSPTDPATLGSASALMLVTAIVASWLPARRAAALDPARALRSE